MPRRSWRGGKKVTLPIWSCDLKGRGGPCGMPGTSVGIICIGLNNLKPTRRRGGGKKICI